MLLRIFLLLIFIFPNFGFAQGLDVFSQPVALEIEPQVPGPNQLVTARIQANDTLANGAEIRWFVDGDLQTEVVNERTFQFKTGQTGETTMVSAAITPTNGVALNLTRSVTPRRVDIVVESNSVVPLHYAGRAVPSSGSQIRLVAIPDASFNPTALTYTWSINNEILFGGPVQGKQVAVFEAPKQDSVLVSVDISDETGRKLGRSLQEIKIAEPIIHFHEVNPLRGLSPLSLPSPFQFVGQEIVIRAEPYFISPNLLDGTDVLTEWEVNNQTLPASAEDAFEVTLRNPQTFGSSQVSFHVRNLNNLLQGARDEIIIRY